MKVHDAAALGIELPVWKGKGKKSELREAVEACRDIPFCGRLMGARLIDDEMREPKPDWGKVRDKMAQVEVAALWG